MKHRMKNDTSYKYRGLNKIKTNERYKLYKSDIMRTIIESNTGFQE